MRRGLRIASWIVGALLLSVVALVAALLIAGNTAGGRVWLEHVTVRVTSGHVRISGLAGSFPASSAVADKLSHPLPRMRPMAKTRLIPRTLRKRRGSSARSPESLRMTKRPLRCLSQ